MHGVIFRHDNPFWQTHFPPNGYNCRCEVEALDDFDIEAQGLTVETDPTPYTDCVDEGWDYNGGDVELAQRAIKKKAEKFPEELYEQLELDFEEFEDKFKQAKEQAKKLLEESKKKRNISDNIMGADDVDSLGIPTNDPTRKRIGKEEITNWYRQYEKPSKVESEAISTYVEGKPPIFDPQNQRLLAYQSIQKTLRTHPEILDLSLEELQRKGFTKHSPEIVAKTIYETLSRYKVPEGIVLFRNSNTFDLVNMFMDQKIGTKILARLNQLVRDKLHHLAKELVEEIRTSLLIKNTLRLKRTVKRDTFLSTSIRQLNFKPDETTVIRVIRTSENINGIFVPYVIDKGEYSKKQAEVLINPNVVEIITDVRYKDGVIIVESVLERRINE